jgi:hypothetical protein
MELWALGLDLQGLHCLTMHWGVLVVDSVLLCFIRLIIPLHTIKYNWQEFIQIKKIFRNPSGITQYFN